MHDEMCGNNVRLYPRGPNYLKGPTYTTSGDFIDLIMVILN